MRPPDVPHTRLLEKKAGRASGHVCVRPWWAHSPVDLELGVDPALGQPVVLPTQPPHRSLGAHQHHNEAAQDQPCISPYYDVIALIS